MARFINVAIAIVIILICSISLIGCVFPSGDGNIGNNGGDENSGDSGNIDGDIAPDGGDTSPDGGDTSPDGGIHICLSSEWKVFAATCMDTGWRVRTCVECGEKLEEVVTPIDNGAHRDACVAMECGHHSSVDKAHTSYNNKECSGYHLSCYEGAHTAEICGSKMLSYVEIEGGLTVSNNGNTNSVIYIPSRHNGKDVVRISERGFASNAFLEKVFIADTVKKIDDNAFSSCTNLAQVDFGSVEVIGEHTFSGTRLVSADLPLSIKQIGFSAFYKVKDLASITLPHMSRESGKDFFGYIFGAESYMTNRTYVPQSLKVVNLVGNNINLAQFSFYNCTGIERIYVSGNSNIADNAFANCAFTLQLHVSDALEAPSDWGKLWNVTEYPGNERFVTEWNCVCKP